MSRRNLVGLGASIALLMACGQANGGYINMATDRFGYTGSITEYASLGDATTGMNSLGTFNVGQRDLSIAFTNDPVTPSNNFYQTLTAWYYTLTGPNLGDGNPSNQNKGFVQVFDAGATTVTSFAASFSGPALTTYNLQVSGANADTANALARLGPQGSNSDSQSTTAGTFLTYNLNATFSNLNPATFNSVDNAYDSDGDPKGVSVSGTFSGIFENPSGPFAGYYTFNFTLDNTSWAYHHRHALDRADYTQFMSSFYEAGVAAVPEPSSFVLSLVGMGIMSSAVGLRRCGRRQSPRPQESRGSDPVGPAEHSRQARP